MARFSILGGIVAALLAIGCGAADEKPAPAQKAAFGAEQPVDDDALTPASVEPPSIAAQSPLIVVADDAAPLTAPARAVCNEILDIANERRAMGALFYAIDASRGDIVAPSWSPLDAGANETLIVDGLYDNWCEAPARVSQSTGSAFTDEETRRCRDDRTAGFRELLAGAPRLESAEIDLDRDSVADSVYQLVPDPALAARSGESWTLWNLQPRLFVSAGENPELHRQLHRTTFAPEASLFMRADALYALRAWNGKPDRYEIFEIVRTQNRLGQIPLCQLIAAGESNDQ